MKTMFLAAAAAFLLLGGAAQAKAVAPGGSLTQTTDEAAQARQERSQVASSPLRTENPTGLPAYEMRPDGLMLNGLLPANGWQG
jgi:hypothetical protein